MSSIPISSSNVPHITSLDLAGMDMETVLMAIQSERTRLLDTQLASQLKEVENRNAQIAKLNNVLVHLHGYASQIKGNDATSKPKEWTNEEINRYEIPLNDAIREAGIADLGFSGTAAGVRSKLDSNGKPTGDRETLAGPAVCNGSTTKGEIDAAITRVKGAIDAESNAQQMDMLRLQSLSNKRNEAFDVMTNYIKKMQDNRSALIANLR